MKIKFNIANVTGIIFPIVISVILIYIELKTPLPEACSPLNGKLTEVQQNNLNYRIDSNKQFLAWSIAIIVALAFILKIYFDKGLKFSTNLIIISELTLIATIFSIFWGHLEIEYILLMLSFDTFNPLDNTMCQYARLQYIFFLISLILLFFNFHLLFLTNKK